MEERSALGEMVKVRMEGFLKTGQMDLTGNIFEDTKNITRYLSDIGETCSDEEFVDEHDMDIFESNNDVDNKEHNNGCKESLIGDTSHQIINEEDLAVIKDLFMAGYNDDEDDETDDFVVVHQMSDTVNELDDDQGEDNALNEETCQDPETEIQPTNVLSVGEPVQALLYHKDFRTCTEADFECEYEQDLLNQKSKKPESEKRVEFVCNVECCSYTGKTEKLLNTHKRRNHPIDPQYFSCEKCSFKCMTGKGLTKHQVSLHDAIQCRKTCGLVLNGKKEERKHFLNIHGRDGKRARSDELDRPPPCPLCGAQYTWKSGLRAHIRSNHGHNFERILSEEEAGNTHSTVPVHPVLAPISSPANVSPSTLLNRQSRDYRDSDKVDKKDQFRIKGMGCQKGFKYQNIIKNHRKEHTEGKHKKNKCPMCWNLFVRKGTLSTHIATQHSNWLCTVCDKNIQSENKLKKHMERTHEEVDCKKCGQRLQSKEVLRNHLQSTKCRTRDNIAEKCPHCGKVMGNKDSLRAHMKSQHKWDGFENGKNVNEYKFTLASEDSETRETH